MKAWSQKPDRPVVIVVPPDYADEIASELYGEEAPPPWPQHDGRGLASYVPARGTRRFIRAKYSSAVKAEDGLRRLLTCAAFRRWRGVFLLEVMAGVARDLIRRAREDETDSCPVTSGEAERQYRLLVAREAEPVTVDPELRKRFLGESVAAQEIRLAIARAARHQHPVLIHGETGTGKDVVAREIHRLSRGNGRTGPFVPVNSAAIADTLVESELFGHLRGAFTGAVQNNPGLLAAAAGGTIFLDEIGDLPLGQQPKALRMLDGGHYRPVGGQTELQSDARVVAATSKDLLRLVREGRFREDLYFRLRGCRIVTPALRDHPEDIPELARHFWRSLCETYPLPGEALPVLQQHAWNGNARELRAFLEELHGNIGNRSPSSGLLAAALWNWKSRAGGGDYAWAASEKRRDP